MVEDCENIEGLMAEVEKSLETIWRYPSVWQGKQYIEKAFPPIKAIYCKYLCDYSECPLYGGIRFESDQ